MFGYLLFESIFIYLVYAESLGVRKIDIEIDDSCWILDTNNLTEIGMGDCRGKLYYVNLGIGTPPTYSNFLIDTLRDQMWLPINDTFMNTSETFEISEEKMVTYSHHNVYEGQVGSDIVSVEETNISTRSSIVWAEPSFQETVPELIDGLLGMGYSGEPNFLENAVQNNQINSSIFALEIGNMSSPSAIYYNELPEEIIQKTIFTPVIGTLAWTVSLQNVRIGDFDYSSIIPNKLIVDTGTSLMYLNEELYNNIFERYFRECKKEPNKKPVCPCEGNWPDMTLVLNELSITIPPSSYFRFNEEGKCTPMFGKTVDDSCPLLMGASMMENYIITFDKQNGMIGFTGQPAGLWKSLFVLFEFLMASYSLIVVGFGLYLLWTIRYHRKDKESKVKDKQKEKLLQMTSYFLEPEP